MLRTSKRTAVSSLILALSVIASTVGILSCGPPEPVRVGVLIPESGTAAVYGESIRRGIELAVETVNEKGGVQGGRILEIDVRDTGTDTVIAEAAARELIALEYPVVIGAAASKVSLHVAPLFNESGTVLISPASSSPRLTKEGGPWFFRVYPSDVGEAYRMASFCRENVIPTVGVIAVTDSFGQGSADEFVRKYEAATREVVYRKDFDAPLDEEAAAEIVAGLAGESPEAVYIAAYVDDMATLVKEMKRANLKIVRLGTSAVTDELIAKAGDAADGVVFPSPIFDPLSSEVPEMQGFVARYMEKYGEPPNTYAVKGYDALQVVAQAIDQVSVVLPKQVQDILLTKTFTGAGSEIRFNLSGDVSEPPRLFAVAQGEIVPYEKYREAMVNKSILSQ